MSACLSACLSVGLTEPFIFSRFYWEFQFTCDDETQKIAETCKKSCKKKLQNNFCDGSFIVDFNAINASLELFLDNLCSTVDFAVEYNALTIEDVFKSCGIKPAKTYDSLLEKLVCYVNILIELKSLSFIVLTGFKNVLTADELQAFYKHCELKKVSVLLVEGKVFGEKFPIERRITITEDLCEICDSVDVSY